MHIFDIWPLSDLWRSHCAKNRYWTVLWVYSYSYKTFGVYWGAPYTFFMKKIEILDFSGPLHNFFWTFFSCFISFIHRGIRFGWFCYGWATSVKSLNCIEFEFELNCSQFKFFYQKCQINLWTINKHSTKGCLLYTSPSPRD